jgi:homoserine O-acetyltransferase
VSKGFGGSLERAAATVKAKVLVIAARKDAVVTPGAALNFAKLINAKTVVLEGNCGHLATVCESSTVNSEIKKFLEQ